MTLSIPIDYIKKKKTRWGFQVRTLQISTQAGRPACLLAQLLLLLRPFFTVLCVVVGPSPEALSFSSAFRCICMTLRLCKTCTNKLRECVKKILWRADDRKSTADSMFAFKLLIAKMVWTGRPQRFVDTVKDMQRARDRVRWLWWPLKAASEEE